jgi:hypothetical protein
VNIDHHELYDLTLSPEEAMLLARVINKLAHPASGFSRPAFTASELQLITDLDELLNKKEEK